MVPSYSDDFNLGSLNLLDLAALPPRHQTSQQSCPATEADESTSSPAL